MTSPKHIFSLLALTCAAFQSLAHEFWIEPSAFRTSVGNSVELRLFVGDGYPGEPRPRDPRKLVRFFAIAPPSTTNASNAPAVAATTLDIAGVDGDEVGGTLTCSQTGLYIVGYQSNSTLLTLDAVKFEEYLVEEGLTYIVDARAKAGQNAAPGRERYSRAAKTIIRAGEPARTAPQTSTPQAFAQLLGFPAEIVPQVDPTLVSAGDSMTFLVLHNNVPAQNVLVLAFSKTAEEAQQKHDAPIQPTTTEKDVTELPTEDASGTNAGTTPEMSARVQRLRTDDQGLVTITLNQPGQWLIANVMMQPAKGKAKLDADWESTWASLTIDVQPQAAPMSNAAKSTN